MVKKFPICGVPGCRRAAKSHRAKYCEDCFRRSRLREIRNEKKRVATEAPNAVARVLLGTCMKPNSARLGTRISMKLLREIRKLSTSGLVLLKTQV